MADDDYDEKLFLRPLVAVARGQKSGTGSPKNDSLVGMIPNKDRIKKNSFFFAINHNFGSKSFL